MRMVQVAVVHLPEIGHGGETVVAAHGPHGVGIGAGDKESLLSVEGQQAVVLQQHYRLGGQCIGCLPFLGAV